MALDRKSGFCESNSIFYSKRDPMILPPPNQYLDVTTFISSQPHRGTTAFVDAVTGRRLGFSELWLGVKRVAARLYSLGVRKGDVVVILSPNSILYPVVSLAVMSLGAVITTANPISTSGEISKQLEDSLPVLAFTTCQLVSKLAAAAAAAAAAVNSNLPVVLMDGVEADEKGVKIVGSLETMMESETSESRVRQRVNQDDTAALLYSSGTTGKSKGVMITHRNLIALVHTYRLRFGLEQRTVCTIPMCHVFSFGGFATSYIALGWTTVVLPKFEMAKLLSAVEVHRPTHLTLVPPMIVGMVNGAKEINAKYDVSSLHTVVAGGAPLSREVIEKFVKNYPNVKVLQGYGLTETTAIVATMFTKEETERFGSSGLLSPNVEAKIVDPETGRLLGVDQTGELWLRSPTVMKGYYKNEEATADTIDSEGWLKTGDLCYIDSEGFVFVVDRLKELIKCNGYQVAPAELEAVLLAHPEIDDAAVIPLFF
ncbi:4-coumarate--CoA ligase-like 2 [Hirschfeldia incana]|nr:4-coumarate--CoA ligase-like 2 [Hirschfeldia incana]